MVEWVSAKDVPGENKVKGGASDSPVFAEGKVEHVGQVIGLVVAESPRAAQVGAAKVAIRYGHPKVRFSISSPCQLFRPKLASRHGFHWYSRGCSSDILLCLA